MPNIVDARVVAGHVAWCTGGDGWCRVTGAPYDQLLFITFEKDNDPAVRFYSLRQHPEGLGVDHQHTVGGETTFFFKTDNITDHQAALYLFGMVETPVAVTHPFSAFFPNFRPNTATRSEPLLLDELEWRRGDQEDCAICLDKLGDEPDVLSCGHAFHLDCLTKSQQLHQCANCARNSKFPAVTIAGASLCTEAMHLARIKCPVCREWTQ